MATTEATKLDTLKAKFQEHLDQARQKLEEMKQEIAEARDQSRDALDRRRDAIHERVQGQYEHLKELRQSAVEWRQEKVDQTRDAITSWKEKLELDKLARRADRAEDSAVDAMYIALLDVDAAEEAMLDAIDARLDFEDAQVAQA